jgi:NhaC family Na+:H+ antiporter
MNTKTKRNISTLEALLPIILIVVAIFIGNLIFKLQFETLLILVVIITGFIAVKNGITFDELLDAYGSKVKRAFPVILLIISIGAVVGTWMFSGTVPMLIYYGLKFIDPKFAVASGFIITSLVSLFTGTSWGAAATSGVAFMGIAQSLGIPAPMMAGAIISGAFFGDKLSSVSDTTNLSALAAEVSVYEHIKSMLPNVMLSGFLATIGFTIIGFKYDHGASAITPETLKIISDLDIIFNFNILMLLPAIIVFGGALLKYKSLILMLGSSFIAMILGVTFNNFSLVDATASIITGFNTNMLLEKGVDPSTISETLLFLLNRGGMKGMMGAVMVSLIIFAFGSFIEKLGTLDLLVKGLKKIVKGSKSLIIGSFVSSALLISIISNGQFVILTIGDLFKEHYNEKQLPRTLLSRAIENGTTLYSGLIPFTVTGVYMAQTLGVSVFEYVPWAFFNIISICLFVFVFMPLEIKKAKKYKTKSNVNYNLGEKI